MCAPVVQSVAHHRISYDAVMSVACAGLLVESASGGECDQGDDCQAFAPGDVLLFRYANRYPAKHAAIATAPDLMVHAHDGAAVAEVAIAPWWRRRLAFAFAFRDVKD